MGSDVFVWHGYTEVLVDGNPRKASPAFNDELCARFGVPPLEFDGSGDALLHAFDGSGRRHMEYLTDHGTFREVPLQQIVGALTSAYPSMTSAPEVHDARFAHESRDSVRASGAEWDEVAPTT